MKQLVCILLMAVVCLACAIAPARAEDEEDALRTREQLAQKLNNFIGKSDRTLVRLFRSEFPSARARTLAICCLDNDAKKTTIAWSADYRRRSATPSVRTSRVQNDPDHQGQYQSQAVYAVKAYEQKCVVQFLSRNGLISGFTMEGEGCIW